MSVERTQLLRVRTPEGVAFTFHLASPVLRAGAVVIDWAIVMAGTILLSIVGALIRVISEDFAGLLMAVSFFLLSEGYHIALEWLWNGQTLGKRMLRLRVVDARGLRLTFSQVALRNLLRFVDALPAFYLVGGLTALLNSRAQRLGDLAADTLVVWQPTRPQPDFSNLSGGKYNSLRTCTPVVARLRHGITPGEARAAWTALLRRDQLEAASRLRLFGELATHFRQVANVPEEVIEGVSDEQFVRNVVEVLYVNRA